MRIIGATPIVLLALSTLLAAAARAQPASSLETCAAIDDPMRRLACYDAVAGRTEAKPVPAEAPVRPSSTLATVEPGPARSPLGERWAIGARDSLFDIRPHQPTYILFARRTDSVNQLPQSPTQPPPDEPLGLDSVEAKFQLSFKLRIASFDREWLPDIWAGYTQQSQWQVYNRAISRPFRETDFQPELMLAWHPDLEWQGWRWRLLNIALAHQSNGFSDPLSRSWNRLYAQFGVERGNFVLLLRPWYRLKENIEDDDNPDITDYYGYGDLVASYTWREHQFAATGRLNFRTGKGFIEASWSFPLQRRVRGYAQLTSGYGESLIDYNWRQTTYGLGIALTDWQ
jgi:phospholipase A1